MTVYVAEEFSAREPTSCGATSPTSTARCSRWSTCPRWSRARCSPATRARPKSLRRLFLDEFVGELDISGDADHRRHGRPAARRGALRPGLLRVRRRLRGPARWRAPGLRAGLEPARPRCSSGAGSCRTSSSPPATSPTTPASAAATATTATPGSCGSPLGTRYVGDMDRLFDTYAELLPAHDRTSSRSSSPRTTSDSDFVYRQAIRAKAFDAAARHPAGRVAVQRRHLRHRPGLRGAAAAHAVPPAARGADLRRPHARTSCARSSRRSSSASTSPTGAWPGATTWPTNREAMDDMAERFFPRRRPRPTPAPAVDAGRLRPRRRGQAWSRRCSTRTPTCPSARSRSGCGP